MLWQTCESQFIALSCCVPPQIERFRSRSMAVWMQIQRISPACFYRKQPKWKITSLYSKSIYLIVPSARRKNLRRTRTQTVEHWPHTSNPTGALNVACKFLFHCDSIWRTGVMFLSPHSTIYTRLFSVIIKLKWDKTETRRHTHSHIAEHIAHRSRTTCFENFNFIKLSFSSSYIHSISNNWNEIVFWY